MFVQKLLDTLSIDCENGFCMKGSDVTPVNFVMWLSVAVGVAATGSFISPLRRTVLSYTSRTFSFA